MARHVRYGLGDVSSQAAQLTADEEAAAAASYHAVLLSPDLWLELFQWLDRGSKVDGSIETVASPKTRNQ
jgi:hypothetical protein